MNIRDKFVVWLEGKGWQRDHTARTQKYWVYKHPDYQAHVYLGRAGSFRMGRSVAASVPISDGRRNVILAMASM